MNTKYSKLVKEKRYNAARQRIQTIRYRKRRGVQRTRNRMLRFPQGDHSRIPRAEESRQRHPVLYMAESRTPGQPARCTTCEEVQAGVATGDTQSVAIPTIIKAPSIVREEAQPVEWATVAGKPIPVRAVPVEGWRLHYEELGKTRFTYVIHESINSRNRQQFANRFQTEDFARKERQYESERLRAIVEANKNKKKAG